MEPITAAFVLSLMSHLPSVEAPANEAERRPGGWEKMAQADVLAHAIAQAINVEDPLFGDAEFTAAYMTTWVVFEGGVSKVCASGDGGKSWGPFQLSIVHTPRAVACQPELAAARWITLARSVLCSDRQPNEQLSAVASGNCGHGHVLTRRRFALANRALEAVLPKE